MGSPRTRRWRRPSAFCRSGSRKAAASSTTSDATSCLPTKTSKCRRDAWPTASAPSRMRPSLSLRCRESPASGTTTRAPPARASSSRPARSHRRLPDLPRWPARGPLLLEHHLVAQSVHGVPEAGVPVRRELVLVSESLHGLALPHGLVAVDVVQHRRLDDEEAAVDPSSF